LIKKELSLLGLKVKMKKEAQNLHAPFITTQVLVLVDYFSQVTTEWE